MRHQRQRERDSPSGVVELGHVLEVHAPDAGDEGRDGDDRRPGRDLPARPRSGCTLSSARFASRTRSAARAAS